MRVLGLISMVLCNMGCTMQSRIRLDMQLEVSALFVYSTRLFVSNVASISSVSVPAEVGWSVSGSHGPPMHFSMMQLTAPQPGPCQWEWIVEPFQILVLC